MDNLISQTPKNKWFKSYKVGLFIVFGLALFLAGMWTSAALMRQKVVSSAPKPAPAEEESVKKSSKLTNVKNVDPDKLPELIPSDFPLDFAAALIDNYDSVTQNGLRESKRSYVSQKPLPEAFASFENYFNKNTWNIGYTKNDEKNKIIIADKNGLSLNINLNETMSGKYRTVAIIATEIKPQK